MAQQLLPFDKPQNAVQAKRVTLSDVDAAYRQKCIDEDQELPEYMLLDTRCQRIGCSKSYFTHMPKFEQNRELADEACLMRYSDWEYSRPTFVDWPKVNAEAKAVAQQFQNGYAEFVRMRIAVPEVTGRSNKKVNPQRTISHGQ
jgi:hypothetical protein